jgi:hypothetical protein
MDFTLSYCLVSAAIFATACYFLRRQRLDDYRSDLRRVRDGLFDFMLAHGHAFDHPGYRETRQTLNGLIRYSDYLTPFTFLSMALVFRKHGDLFGVSEKTERSHGDPVEVATSEAKKAAAVVTLHFVFLTGPFGLVVKTLLFFLRLSHAARKVTVWSTRVAQRFVEAAYSWGEPGLCQERIGHLSHTR